MSTIWTMVSLFLLSTFDLLHEEFACHGRDTLKLRDNSSFEVKDNVVLLKNRFL